MFFCPTSTRVFVLSRKEKKGKLYFFLSMGFFLSISNGIKKKSFPTKKKDKKKRKGGGRGERCNRTIFFFFFFFVNFFSENDTIAHPLADGSTRGEEQEVGSLLVLPCCVILRNLSTEMVWSPRIANEIQINSRTWTIWATICPQKKRFHFHNLFYILFERIVHTNKQKANFLCRITN